MKRFIALLVLSFGIVSLTYAVPQVQVTSANGSDTAEVKNGALPTTGKARYKMSFTGSKQVYTGPCYVQSINIYSDTLGDVVGVSDIPAITWYWAPTWMELEIGIAANTSSNSVDAKGAYFENGIYVTASDTTNTVTTVIFDY